MAIYKNITSSTTTTLITKGGVIKGNISKITISNNDGHPALNVGLFLEDAAASASTDAGNNKYYFIKDVDIPVGVTLVLDDSLSFSSSAFNLRIVTQNAADGGTPSLTIIIK
jgi:hypothetical protein